MNNSQENKIKSGADYLSVLENRYKGSCVAQGKRGYGESSILNLSLSIGKDIDEGQADFTVIRDAVRELTTRSLIRRAEQTGKYIAPHDDEENKKILREMFTSCL